MEALSCRAIGCSQAQNEERKSEYPILYGVKIPKEFEEEWGG